MKKQDEDMFDLKLELLSASYRDITLQMTERKMIVERNRNEFEKILSKYDLKDKNKTYNPEEVKEDITRMEKLLEESKKLAKEFAFLLGEYNGTFVDDLGFYDIDFMNTKKNLNFMDGNLNLMKKRFVVLFEEEKE